MSSNIPNSPIPPQSPNSSVVEPLYNVDFVNDDLQTIFKSRDLFAQLIKEVLPPEIYDRFDWESATWETPSFLSPQASDRSADVLWQIGWRENPDAPPINIVVLLENQLKPIAHMALRIFLYMARFWDRELSQWEKDKKPIEELKLSIILPIVFHVSPDSQWTKATTLTKFVKPPKQLAPFVPEWKTVYWSLINHSPTDLLNSDKELFQALAVARVQKQSPKKYREVFLKTVEKLSQSTNLNHSEITSLLELALDYNLNRRSKSEWENLAKLAKPHLSKFKEFENMTGVRRDSVIGETWEKGIAQGRTEGALQTYQELVTKRLFERFDSVPQDVLDQIAQCQSIPALDLAFSSIGKLKSPKKLVLQP